MHSASDGYFEAMGAEIAKGRAFTPFDGADAAGVVVVNDIFAKRYLADKEPIGQTMLSWATGIGPLGVNLKATRLPGTRRHAVRDRRRGGATCATCRSVRQSNRPSTSRRGSFRSPKSSSRCARSREEQRADGDSQRAAKGHANVPMGITQTWGDRFAAKTAEARLLMSILVFFGGLAGLLAALGVYGLFSWSVALRTRELAIRLTLGAKPAEVGALVLRQSALLIVAGLVVGFVIIRFAESILTRVLVRCVTKRRGRHRHGRSAAAPRRAHRLRAAGTEGDEGGSGRGITG